MSDRRYAEVLIYKGDDLAELAHLSQVAVQTRRKYEEKREAGTLRGEPSPKDAEDAYDAKVAEAAERATLVRIEAIGRKEWRALLAAHPARREMRVVDDAKQEVTVDEDEQFAVNTETFPEALLTFVKDDDEDDIMRTIAAPSFDSTAALVKFLNRLSSGDFDKLWTTAYALNGVLGVDPKSTTFAAGSLSSSEMSG